MSEGDGSFLSRWSRRKALVREGVALPPEPPPVPPAPPAIPPLPAEPAAHAGGAAAGQPPTADPPPDPSAAPPDPPPTLADVQALDGGSDYTRFVRRDVAPEVRNAALKRMFSDAHFNVMDGLDVYIDDYGQPDPLPAGMLRKMAQAHVLGLFDHEKAPPAPGGGHDTATLQPAQSVPAAAGDPPASPPVAADLPPSTLAHAGAGAAPDGRATDTPDDPPT